MSDCISIIVPVYRAEKYLPQCIESILAQTYRRLEILLIDDGSPDRCGEICDEYARLDARIRVIHQQNRGVSAARNAGLDQATGAYIGFVDADDWIEPDMFERMHEWIKQERLEMVACGWIIHEEQTGSAYTDRDYACIRATDEEALYRMLDRVNYMGVTWNKLFDAKVFVEEDFQLRFDENLYICEDLLLVCRCFIAGAAIYYRAKPLYHYRVHPESTLNIFKEEHCSELIGLHKIIDLLNNKSERLTQLLRGRYCETAISLRSRAARGKLKKIVKELRPEVWRYAGTYFCSNKFFAIQKLRSLLLLCFPILSLKIWRILRKRFHVKWVRPNKPTITSR